MDHQNPYDERRPVKDTLTQYYYYYCICNSDPESDFQREWKAAYSVRCRPTWEINLYLPPRPVVEPGPSALKANVLLLGHRGSANLNPNPKKHSNRPNFAASALQHRPDFDAADSDIPDFDGLPYSNYYYCYSTVCPASSVG